ncbi:MAG: Flp pilus assembly protein CpaB [Acidimicrobiales bacterium]
MTRRILGILVAIALALVGTMALVAYVTSAEQRALAGEKLVEVYIVTTPVAGGTAAEDLDELVTVEQVPIKVRAEGAVDNLRALTGYVAAVDLLPGEQLVTGRFVQRSEFADRAIGIDVPGDMVEVTVELDAQRAIGGLLEAGQTVAVIASFEPFKLSRTVIPIDGEAVPLPSAVADDVEGTTPNSSGLLLRKVLVTAVQERENTSTEEDDQRLTTAPEGTVFVTLAVTPFDVERVVFTAEFGDLWLAIERETVPESAAPGQTRGSVLLDRPRAK